MPITCKSAIAGALVLVGAAYANVACAQVFEIGQQGVAIYDRPTVFSREGSVAISLGVRASQPPAGRRFRPTPIADLAGIAASAAALSPELVEAVAWQESRGRHGLVSRKGAMGEMQLMPEAARALRVDPRDAAQNYRGGAAYLAQLLKRYDGDLQLALAAYNAGPGAVDRHRGAPPYKETQAYVAAVLDRLSRRAEAQGE